MTMAAKSARLAGLSVTAPDIRTGKRFPLQLPITISEDHSPREHRATTDNVSAAGVFLRAANPLNVGSRISFDIMLPGTVLGAEGDVKIRCAGRVVRAESSRRGPRSKQAATQLRGMACVIDQYRFIRDAME
jgi:PilZ domain